MVKLLEICIRQTYFAVGTVTVTNFFLNSDFYRGNFRFELSLNRGCYHSNANQEQLSRLKLVLNLRYVCATGPKSLNEIKINYDFSIYEKHVLQLLIIIQEVPLVMVHGIQYKIILWIQLVVGRHHAPLMKHLHINYDVTG